MDKKITRRNFLGKMVTGFLFIAAGSTRKIAWPIQGSEKGSVRLIFYTDVHARTELETPVAMARAATAINAQKADLVIGGGDFITGGFQSCASKVSPRWDAYMKMHCSIDTDLYTVIGNHDLVAANPQAGTPPSEDPRSIYRSKMGLDRTYYSFNAVGYHFVMLDSVEITQDEYQYQGMIRPEQLQWLKRDLSQLSPITPVVLVLHIPLLSAFFMATGSSETSGVKKNRIIVNRQEVFNIIADYNVILVLQGHLHVKELLVWRGTTFIGGGAVCGKWWRGPWYGTEEGFNIITLTGNHVEWEYVDYGWEVRHPGHLQDIL